MSRKQCEPCPANRVPSQAQDTMWYFLMQGGQKANVPALKDAVNDLCHLMTQKTAGQRKNGKKSDIDFGDVDMIMWTIVAEATALVLSGELDKLSDEQSS